MVAATRMQMHWMRPRTTTTWMASCQQWCAASSRWCWASPFVGCVCNAWAASSHSSQSIPTSPGSMSCTCPLQRGCVSLYLSVAAWVCVSVCVRCLCVCQTS